MALRHAKAPRLLTVSLSASLRDGAISREFRPSWSCLGYDIRVAVCDNFATICDLHRKFASKIEAFSRFRRECFMITWVYETYDAVCDTTTLRICERSEGSGWFRGTQICLIACLKCWSCRAQPSRSKAMDPNTALGSILCGHMMQEHLEALKDWLQGGGFEPEPIWLPVDCAPCFSDLPHETDLTIGVNGLFDTEGNCYFSWRELEKFAENCDETGCDGCLQCI
jgi:hypothetical protein